MVNKICLRDDLVKMARTLKLGGAVTTAYKGASYDLSLVGGVPRWIVGNGGRAPYALPSGIEQHLYRMKETNEAEFWGVYQVVSSEMDKMKKLEIAEEKAKIASAEKDKRRKKDLVKLMASSGYSAKAILQNPDYKQVAGLIRRDRSLAFRYGKEGREELVRSDLGDILKDPLSYGFVRKKKAQI